MFVQAGNLSLIQCTFFVWRLLNRVFLKSSSWLKHFWKTCFNRTIEVQSQECLLVASIKAVILFNIVTHKGKIFSEITLWTSFKKISFIMDLNKYTGVAEVRWDMGHGDAASIGIYYTNYQFLEHFFFGK